MLYKRSLRKPPSGTGTEWLLKIQCMKKTDNQQQLKPTKKSWEEYLEKAKYSQSCI